METTPTALNKEMSCEKKLLIVMNSVFVKGIRKQYTEVALNCVRYQIQIFTVLT